MGKYRDRLKAAMDEVAATSDAAVQAEHGPNDGSRAEAYERQLQAGANVWRAIAGKDPRHPQ